MSGVPRGGEPPQASLVLGLLTLASRASWPCSVGPDRVRRWLGPQAQHLLGRRSGCGRMRQGPAGPRGALGQTQSRGQGMLGAGEERPNRGWCGTHAGPSVGPPTPEDDDSLALPPHPWPARPRRHPQAERLCPDVLHADCASVSPLDKCYTQSCFPTVVSLQISTYCSTRHRRA